MTWREIAESKQLGNHKINLKLFFRKIYQNLLEKIFPVNIFPSLSSTLQLKNYVKKMKKKKKKRINLINIRKSMQTLFNTATVKCLLKSIKPNTKTSKFNLWPLKGKTKLNHIWKLWVRCSAVEKHCGFLESREAKFPHISQKKV